MNFSFVVVADSIKDLLPMWKRINYFYGLTKPSNYTMTGTSNNTDKSTQYVSHFVIPPMVKMTIGDFYKNQPIVIDSIQITIPDDAQWETISEGKREWTYGPLVYSAPGRTAQFPRVCELQVQCKLLEKERPQSGHNNWGDSLLWNDNRSSNPFSYLLKQENKSMAVITEKPVEKPVADVNRTLPTVTTNAELMGTEFKPTPGLNGAMLQTAGTPGQTGIKVGR
jgi:hypothetical protein